MSQLIIRLPSTLPTARARLRYALVHGSGRDATSRDSVADALPRGSEATLVIPSSMCSWHRARLPSGLRGDAPMRAAIEGVLEERLLCEPSDLHFALMGEQDDGTSWIAACDMRWLAAWSAHFKSFGIETRRIVPEAAPSDQPLAIVHHDGDRGSRVALCDESGVACAPFLPSTIPLHYSVVSEPSLSELAAHGGRVALIQTFAERMMRSSQAPFGFDQFTFSSTPAGRAKAMAKDVARDLWRGREWGMARAAAFACALFWLASIGAQAWRSESRIASRQAETRHLVKTTFPHITSVIDPSFQMRRELDALRSSSGIASASDLEAELSALGGLAPQAALGAKTLKYSEGSLRFDGPALGPEAQAALLAAGYEARRTESITVLHPVDASTPTLEKKP
jgi:general secretion pathway protein L